MNATRDEGRGIVSLSENVNEGYVESNSIHIDSGHV